MLSHRKAFCRRILLFLLILQVWVPAGDAMSCSDCIKFHLKNLHTGPATDAVNFSRDTQPSTTGDEDSCPDGAECCLICANVYAPSPSSYQVLAYSAMFMAKEPVSVPPAGLISSVFRPPKTI
jgi:hypothetical protein